MNFREVQYRLIRIVKRFWNCVKFLIFTQISRVKINNRNGSGSTEVTLMLKISETNQKMEKNHNYFMNVTFPIIHVSLLYHPGILVIQVPLILKLRRVWI